MTRRLTLYSVWLRSPLFIGVSFLLLWVVSRAASPMTAITGIDYDMFVMGGDALLRGNLYTGFFDNKGPYLFGIYALGLALSPGKWGIFLIDVLNFALCLELLWRIGELLGASVRRTLAGLTLFILLYATMAEGGATVEVFSLPAMLVVLLLSLTTILHPNSRRGFDSWWQSVISGLCIGFVAMMRLNNAAPLLACVAVVLAATVDSGRRRVALRHLLALFCGILMAVAPAFIYFAVKGSVAEMLDASIIYNLEYASVHRASGLRVWLTNCALIGGCLLWPLVCLSRRGLEGRWLTVLSIAFALACIVAFTPCWSLQHYAIMAAPTAALVLMTGIGVKRPWLVLASVAILLPNYAVSHSDYSVLASRIYERYFNRAATDSLLNYMPGTMERTLRFIPIAERDSIYQLDLPRDYWGISHYMDYSPGGRHRCQQTMIASTSPQRRAEVESEFGAVRPLWVISGAPLEHTCISKFNSAYSCVDSLFAAPDNYLYIYRRTTD